MRMAVLLLAAVPGCEPDAADERAQLLMRDYGCTACHVVPGTSGPHGATGPPLVEMAEQSYVAGVAPNTLEALAAFIVDPQATDPRSAMPQLGVSREEALAMARYLYDVGGGR